MNFGSKTRRKELLNKIFQPMKREFVMNSENAVAFASINELAPGIILAWISTSKFQTKNFSARFYSKA